MTMQQYSWRDMKGRDDKPYSSLDAPKYAPYKNGKGQLDFGMKPIEIPSHRDWEEVLFEVDKFWPYYMNKKNWLFDNCRDVVYQDINKKKMSRTHRELGMMTHMTITELQHEFGHYANIKNPNWDDWDTNQRSYEPLYFERIERKETKEDIRYKYRNFFGGPEVSLTALGRNKYGLEEMARFVQEDLCLLRRRDDGWNLRAAAVCFPSYWSLNQKMGKPLSIIHGPVPQLTPEINDVVTAKMDDLECRVPVERFNWTLTCDSELHQPSSYRGSKPEFADNLSGVNIFVRVERQTLTKLSRNGDILFTIRTYLNPLRAIIQDRDLSIGLHDSIMTTPIEVLDYRGIDLFGSKVLRFIDGVYSDNRTCPGASMEYHR